MSSQLKTTTLKQVRYFTSTYSKAAYKRTMATVLDHLKRGLINRDQALTLERAVASAMWAQKKPIRSSRPSRRSR